MNVALIIYIMVIISKTNKIFKLAATNFFTTIHNRLNHKNNNSEFKNVKVSIFNKVMLLKTYSVSPPTTKFNSLIHKWF